MPLEQDHSHNLYNLIIPLKMTISQKTEGGRANQFLHELFFFSKYGTQILKLVERGGGGFRPSHNWIFMTVFITGLFLLRPPANRCHQACSCVRGWKSRGRNFLEVARPTQMLLSENINKSRMYLSNTSDYEIMKKCRLGLL